MAGRAAFGAKSDSTFDADEKEVEWAGRRNARFAPAGEIERGCPAFFLCLPPRDVDVPFFAVNRADAPVVVVVCCM